MRSAGRAAPSGRAQAPQKLRSPCESRGEACKGLYAGYTGHDLNVAVTEGTSAFRLCLPINTAGKTAVTRVTFPLSLLRTPPVLPLLWPKATQ